MEERIFNLLLEQEEISWKKIIYDLIESEQMDPWDVNITVLTQKYIEVIKKMQEHDLRISGKILLAAALLLRMKSSHLVDYDLSNLNKLMNQTEEMIEDDLLLDQLSPEAAKDKQKYHLIPKNPQPRSRKVSIYDLVQALQEALASKKRIMARNKPVRFEMPKRKIDIMGVIREMYYKVLYYTEKEAQEGNETKLSFTKLLPPRAGKKEKVYTFIPLLHLENELKIETEQNKPFEEIYVRLLEKKRE